MKPFRFVFLLLIVTSACSHIPRIDPATDSSAQAVFGQCERLFPQGRWQFVHGIEAVPPDGRSYTMIGVIQIASAARTVHCVLMSLEGLVLFEAHSDGDVVIDRALPPFDGGGFARGLMDDLMLLFFVPPPDDARWGYNEKKEPVCRFRMSDGAVRDIIVHDDGQWEIKQYSLKGRPTRTASGRFPVAASGETQGSPRIVLTAHGMFGYRLTLTLVESHEMAPSTSSEKVLQ